MAEVPKSKACEDWRVLAEGGRYEEALVCIRQCLESEPDNGVAWNDMGAALFCLGRAKEAGTCFERAKDLLGQSGKLCWNLVQAYLADGRPGEAAALFEDMQGLGVLNVDTVGRVVDAFMQCGDKASAVEVVLCALRFWPDSAQLRSRYESIRAKRPKVAFFCGADGTTFLKEIHGGFRCASLRVRLMVICTSL
jgi:tetratricopeptide (TPR) repeat protein